LGSCTPNFVIADTVATAEIRVLAIVAAIAREDQNGAWERGEGQEAAMPSRRVTRLMCAARLACAAVAGLALGAAGLAGLSGQRAWASPAGSAPGGIISTVAGGVGGPGPARSVAVSPCGVDWAGSWLYIGDGSMVRRVSAATGALTTVAGDNAAGSVGKGGAAVGSAISGACGTVVDGAGNLVIADDSQVRVLAAGTGTFYGQRMTAGQLYAVAGSGGQRDGGPAGDGGPAVKAALSDAADVAFDRAGNMLIADAGYSADCGEENSLGSLVRVVAARTGVFYGQKMTAGNIYTVAGRQAVGPAGNVWLATRASLGTAIGSVRADRAGNLVLADNGEDDYCGVLAPSVRVVAAVTGTFYGVKMTAGHIYRVAGDGRTGSGGDGGPATAASLELAGSTVIDGAGNLVIGDRGRVRVVAARTGRFYGQQMTAGHIYGIAGTGTAGYSGDGGPAGRARVAADLVTLDAAGNVLLGSGNRVETLATGIVPLAGGDRVRVVAARSGRFYGAAMTAGDIYTVAGNGTTFSSGGGPPLRAELTDPTGVTVDGTGDIAFTAVADIYGAQDTAVELISARSGTFFGRRLTAGRLYTLAGDGIVGYRGDNGPARDAEFSMAVAAPAAVAFDGSGNLAVADGNNERVRLIAVRSGRFFGQTMTAGDVYTIAGTGAVGFSGDGGLAVKARLDDPTSAGTDHHGNVLVTDGSRVRVIAAATGTFYGRTMTVGHIYTVAGDGDASFSGDGGPAVKAGLSPQAVATDAAGNLIIADNKRVRLVAVRTGTMYGQKMTASDVYTIAGNGQLGSSGSGGPARKAEFWSPGGATTDRDGNVIFPDDEANVVWVIAVTDGTFYGQSMTAGDIYIVAGGGAILGDGGPAISALLGNPSDVAVTPGGSLLVPDSGDNRLRAISP
jgi:trimeric autotransporter adhesin